MNEARAKEEAARRLRMSAGELSVELAQNEAAYLSADATREKLSQKVCCFGAHSACSGRGVPDHRSPGGGGGARARSPAGASAKSLPLRAAVLNLNVPTPSPAGHRS